MVKLFKALADKNRLKIVNALNSFEKLYTCQIVELLQVTGATTSKHLSILTSAGLISSQKEGRWVIYKLDKSNPHLPQINSILEDEANTTESSKDDQRLKDILEISAEELCRQQRGESCCP